MRLVRHVFDSLDSARYDWPQAPEHPPAYDAAVHAPAQPIARTFLSPSSPTAERWSREVHAASPERALRSAWAYDYARRTVVRTAPRDDPERVFENGLAGFAPDVDLVEALVERALDDGSQQLVLTAFGHAYATREGKAFVDVTLYDAWGSGLEIETPDVECLGIVHDVLGDWKTWVAPIPASEHDALYDRIAELFAVARRHRGLRNALARAYVSGDAKLADGYQTNLNRFHALWERAGSDPAALEPTLPAVGDWKEWLATQSRAIDRDRDLRRRATERRSTLAADAAKVRATLVGVMRQYGALD